MTSAAKLVDVIENQEFEPYDSGFLDVGNGHCVSYEQLGNPTGVPVVFLHGGPGAGCTPGTRKNFNPQVHRAILFDRGPLDASWKLHQAWPGSKLIVVDDEGHGGPKMAEHWSRILSDLASNK